MNSITFDGRLAADAELRYTPSGEPVLSFRVIAEKLPGQRPAGYRLRPAHTARMARQGRHQAPVAGRAR